MPATSAHPSDVAGTARVRAVMAFSHPQHGTWPRGEVRTVPVDDATVALVDIGYLEPVWDSPAPGTTGQAVASPTVGDVTVYPAARKR